MAIPRIKNIKELKKSGWISYSVKDEIRKNLIEILKNKENTFPDILGFENTVIPDIERALLSGHNILLLGLRGQAKTRIARRMVALLDEYIPCIEGSPLNEDPFNPISKYAMDLIAEKGDQTPIYWMHKSERYVEKLATPDVSVADLIGDIDPILAATLKLPYSDERVIHYGLIPRSNRCIFVVNELPDLQPRIQVSLFNLLQEKDLQIRGHKLRWPLDIQFVFTANPEDYTNRGNIITPLKDRIESQILTHYPTKLEIAKSITIQEARIKPSQAESIKIMDIHRNLLERISFEARECDLVDVKSGVSARLSISAYENLFSAAERRMLINGEKTTTVRITDFFGIVPNITGKIELEYEGEQEGPYGVALQLLGNALKAEFLSIFPNPDSINPEKEGTEDPYEGIVNWFTQKNTIELLNDEPDEAYQRKLYSIEGLADFVQNYHYDRSQLLSMMELVIFTLGELNMLTKEIIDKKFVFGDFLTDFLDNFNEDFDEEEEDDNDY
jgi:magnesium chelatase subunit I